MLVRDSCVHISPDPHAREVFPTCSYARTLVSVPCTNGRPAKNFPKPTAKGLLSPLPPIDVLRELRRLINVNNTKHSERSGQDCWTLLRRNVLIPLAGIIGADGRGGGWGKSAALWRGRYSSVQVGVVSSQQET